MDNEVKFLNDFISHNNLRFYSWIGVEYFSLSDVGRGVVALVALRRIFYYNKPSLENAVSTVRHGDKWPATGWTQYKFYCSMPVLPCTQHLSSLKNTNTLCNLWLTTNAISFIYKNTVKYQQTISIQGKTLSVIGLGNKSYSNSVRRIQNILLWPII